MWLFLEAVFGASCACVYFGISVSTLVRDLHLSSIVIVVPMAVANVGASLVQFVVLGICELGFAPGVRCMSRASVSVSHLVTIFLVSRKKP